MPSSPLPEASCRDRRPLPRARRRAAVAAIALLCTAGGLVAGESRPASGAPPSQPSLPRLVGERLIVGFYGTRASSSLLAMVHRGDIAGVIVFSRNVASRSALRALTARLQAARPAGDPPLIVSIDQEGGLVNRLPGAPTMSPARIGARGSVSVAQAQGSAAARNLRSAGVNVDLAPLLDVARRGSIMATTARSYGSNPNLVSRMGVAFIRGLAAGGVAATAKHFPGLGDARSNEDIRINKIDLSQTTLRRIDEAPFRAAAQADIPLVMVSTARYPALGRRPAIFAPKIARDELRGYVGFRGVSITDDLDTPAAERFGSAGDRALASVEAGDDLLLFAQNPGDAVQAKRALLAAVQSGAISTATLQSSAARITALRAGLSGG
jgi:beta-N-acetylhexosaminidase